MLGRKMLIPVVRDIDRVEIFTGDAEGESSIFFKKNYLKKIESRRRQDP